MSTPTSADIYKAACECWAKLDKSGMAYEFTPQSICIASFKDGAEFASAELATARADLTTLRARLAEARTKRDKLVAAKARHRDRDCEMVRNGTTCGACHFYSGAIEALNELLNEVQP